MRLLCRQARYRKLNKNTPNLTRKVRFGAFVLFEILWNSKVGCFIEF